jgi:hypothetical protein
LGVAVFLLPLDIAVRRLALGRRDWVRLWDWVMDRLPGRRRAPEAESPVGRLFEAKARSEARRAAAHRPDALGVVIPKVPLPPPGPLSQPTEERGEPPQEPQPDRPSAPRDGDGDTLAGRLLKRKRRQDE